MRIKNLTLLLGAVALFVASCSDDNLSVTGEGGQGPDSNTSGKRVYVNAGISLPGTFSRSATDESGETNSDAKPDSEYGYDYENDVRTMILVFANTENEFLCYSKVQGLDKAPSGQKYDFNVLAEVKYDDLNAAYKGGFLDDETTVNVYAYCNYTARLEELFSSIKAGDTDWVDWAGFVEEGPSLPGSSPTIPNTIWGNRAFLMTNYSSTQTKFPDDIDGWDDYADKNFPFYVAAPTADQGSSTADRPALTPIKVERSAARIDFKDGSKGENGNPNNNTYNISTEVHVQIKNPDSPDSPTIETSEHNFFDIKLTRMSLVNMSKNFYYLRRVSVDGLNDGSTLLGVETPSNFVVDTDAEAKSTLSIKTAATGDNAASKHFNFCLYTTDSNDPNGTAYNNNGWYTDNITDVLNGTKDTWSGGDGAGSYRIWRYVTENTIPGAANQKTVQSTGVVFKGKILPGKDISEKYDTPDAFGGDERYISEKVEEALNNTENLTIEELPVLYSFDGFLYAGVDELIEKAAEDGKGGRLYSRVDNILSDYKLDGNTYKKGGSGDALDMTTAYLIVTMPDDEKLAALEESDPDLYAKYTSVKGKIIAITDADLEAAASTETGQGPSVAASNGITIYKASDEQDGEGIGYYCYYFYWNRHNDNGKSGLMGTMEFATVRNNVYKLSVTSIAQFGHPRVKSYDPDPEEEERDDEDPLRYIQVDVQVLPWVVRVNDIQF